jgi:hypothetical protein
MSVREQTPETGYPANVGLLKVTRVPSPAATGYLHRTSRGEG